MALSSELMVDGSTHLVTWDTNPKNPEGVCSNKTAAGKTTKIMLISPTYKGQMPRAGETWVSLVERSSGKSSTKGAYYMRPIQRKTELKIKTVWIEPTKADLVITVLLDPRRNLMLQGDQGVGKTTIAAAIAESLGWKYRKISGGLIKKAVYMLGRFIPKGEDKTLMFTYAPSKLIEVLKEANEDPYHTYLIMIDEFTRIDEDARDALLDVIEGKQRSIRLVTGEEVPVGKNVKFMGAGNVGEGFTIRREDAAQSDRWEIIKITCMPPKEELDHCMRLYPAASKKQLELAIEAIGAVRVARREAQQQITKTVSTRRAEAVAMYLANGHKLDVALEAAVANQFDGSAADPNSQAYKVLKIMKDAVAKAS